MRPHLTLNLGLRYEYKSLVTEKDNDFSNFDFSNGELMVAGTNAATLWSFNPSQNPYTGQFQINPAPCTAQDLRPANPQLGQHGAQPLTAISRSKEF